jgi:thiol-disulfide isomerase/thioredoxin
MPYLVAAMVMLGILGLLNLALTVGVIRRLKEQAADPLTHRKHALPPSLPPAGTVVADFTVTTMDGTSLSREELAGETLVGFFSPGCEACEELLPEFAAYAASFPGGVDRVVAVVESMAEDATRYVDALSPVARVVADPPGRGILVPAFSVKAFPGVAVIDADGRIVASGGDIAALPVAVS